MKIIIDSAIPYIKGVMEPYFDVVYKKGATISKEDITSCDAMFIRTRTCCNRELLEGSSVKFIGTATIGTDHIDLQYCEQNGIYVSNAAGCNAMAVAQWVLAAIVEQSKTTPIIPNKTTIGIVGVGNIGTLIAKLFDNMGFVVLKNDPPRALRDKDFYSTPLEDLLEKSDFLTFHTTLSTKGDFPTYHLLNRENISLLNSSATVLNASRGGVIDEEALIGSYDSGKILNMMIDVWEGEPNINAKLLERAKVATSHIAGYSQQGKGNATEMIVKEIAKRFDIWQLLDWYPAEVSRLACPAVISWANLRRLMPLYYDISSDTKALKSSPENFETLRDNYQYRKEFF